MLAHTHAQVSVERLEDTAPATASGPARETEPTQLVRRQLTRGWAEGISTFQDAGQEHGQ